MHPNYAIATLVAKLAWLEELGYEHKIEIQELREAIKILKKKFMGRMNEKI